MEGQERFVVVDAGVDGGPARFELHRDGDVVSYATYHVRDGAVVVPHVETLAQHRGNGFADRLMEGMIDILREQERTIVPICSFAAGYLRQRPEHADLLHRTT